MKKLIFILVVLLSCHALQAQWKIEVDPAAIVADDTVILNYELPFDVSSYGYLVKVEIDPTDTIEFSFGGPVFQEIYTEFASDSLPYEINQGNAININNGDTAYYKVFGSNTLNTGKYGFRVPAFKLWPMNADSTINIFFDFFK